MNRSNSKSKTPQLLSPFRFEGFYLEEVRRGTSRLGSILDPQLVSPFDQLIDIGEVGVRVLSCQTGSQVRRVRRNHQEGEEPPHSRHHPRRNASAAKLIAPHKLRCASPAYMGAISEPCCIRLPTENQRAFLRVNWLTRNSGSSMHGYGLVHSSGQKRPMMKRAMETQKKAAASVIQTSTAKGAAKEKKLGGAFFGFW